MGRVTCAEAAAKTQLLGADPQLHVHPSAAQAEDHQLQVLLNAPDGFAMGQMEVGSVQMLLDLSLQKEAQTALHEQDEQCLDASKVPALPAHVLPASCLVSALCWQGPKGTFLLCHHAQIRYAPPPPRGRC